MKQGQFVNLEMPITPVSPTLGEIGAMPMRRTSFTEISNFKNAALMIFLRYEENNYIHLFPLSLLKWSVVLRPTINNALVKYVVVITLTLHCSQFSTGKSSQPSFNFFTPIATCFIFHNTSGMNNENFRRSFRDLLNSRNPCFVALLETKLFDHLGLMHKLVLIIIRKFLLWGALMVQFLFGIQTLSMLLAKDKLPKNSMQWLR